jgi:hypothetical protein
MPTVRCTSALARLVECPPAVVQGTTVRAALEAYFARYPAVRPYVLDEQGAARYHVAIFVGGDTLVDRAGMSDPVADDGEVYVMQALSGG